MEKKEFAVFGLGRFGKSVALTLASFGAEVLVLDKEESVLQEVADSVTQAICGEATNAALIKELGLRNYDGVIIAMSSSMEANILTTILVKEEGVPFLLVKARNDLEGRVLRKVGADKVIYPEKETGMRLANHLMHGNYLEAVELSEEYSIVEVAIPESWCGKTIKSLDIRASYGVNIIGIRRGTEFNINPGPDDRLMEDDILVMLGRNNHLSEFSERQGS